MSVTLSVPVLMPAAVGVKVTLIVQLAAAARELRQLVVSAKSPLALTAAMPSAVLPELVSVTASGALVVPTGWPPKSRAEGDRLATGPSKNPVPVKLTVWGLFAAASVKVIVPVLVPPAPGANVTLTVHAAPTARLLPHV